MGGSKNGNYHTTIHGCLSYPFSVFHSVSEFTAIFVCLSSSTDNRLMAIVYGLIYFANKNHLLDIKTVVLSIHMHSSYVLLVDQTMTF